MVLTGPAGLSKNRLRYMRSKSALLPLFLVTGAVALTACQNPSRQESLAYVERPVEQLFNQGAAELDSRDYTQAILYFNEVERQHVVVEIGHQVHVVVVENFVVAENVVVENFEIEKFRAK